VRVGAARATIFNPGFSDYSHSIVLCAATGNSMIRLDHEVVGAHAAAKIQPERRIHVAFMRRGTFSPHIPVVTITNLSSAQSLRGMKFRGFIPLFIFISVPHSHACKPRRGNLGFSR
jgi:hypothetical protein